MYAKIVVTLLALLALTSSATAGTTVPLGAEVTGVWCYDRARDNYSRGKCRAARLLKVDADGWEVLGKKCSIQESRKDGAAYMVTAKCHVEGSDDAENFRIALTKGKLAIRPDADSTKNAPSAPPSDGVEQWKSAIISRLERNKRYPPAALSRGESGIARLLRARPRGQRDIRPHHGQLGQRRAG
jgi:hypothetical protein